MEPLTLPLEYAAIEKILPHRYPFLLVDRITELEMDKRIVGVKNISSNEPYLMRSPSGAMVLPPTILTEVIAQVGAILILAKPENQEKLPFFAGIEKVRYRHPVHPGDVVVIEVNVKRLRSRMGVLSGYARVDGKVVVEGTMTFALGPRLTVKVDHFNHQRHTSHLHATRRPGCPSRVGIEIAVHVEHGRRQHHHADPALVDAARRRHATRVPLDRARLTECRAGIHERRDDVKGEHALAERAFFVFQIRMMREDLLAVEILRPEPGRRHDVFTAR